MFKVGDKVLICLKNYSTIGKIIEIEGDATTPYCYRIVSEPIGSNWYSKKEIREIFEYNIVMKDLVNGS